MKIEEIITELRAGNLDDPIKLSNFLVMLSASKLSGQDFELEARIICRTKWLQLKEISDSQGKRKSDKFVDMEIETTPEFKEWKHIEGANTAIQEVIMSLKKKISTTIY